jgi:hypothetical protein
MSCPQTSTILLVTRFKVPEEPVRASFPYRAYMIYLAMKCAPLSKPATGACFGNITFSTVTKTVSRLSARMKGPSDTEGSRYAGGKTVFGQNG